MMSCGWRQLAQSDIKRAVAGEVNVKRSPLVTSSQTEVCRVVSSVDSVRDGKRKVVVASAVPKASLFKEVLQRRRAQSESNAPNASSIDAPDSDPHGPTPRPPLSHNGKTYIVKSRKEAASQMEKRERNAASSASEYDENNNSIAEGNREITSDDEDRCGVFDTSSPTVVFCGGTPDAVKTCQDQYRAGERIVCTDPRPSGNGKQATESEAYCRKRKLVLVTVTGRNSANTPDTSSAQASAKQGDTVSQQWLCLQLYRSFVSTEISMKIAILRHALEERLGSDELLYNYAILRRSLANGADFQHALSRVSEDKRLMYLNCFPLLLQLLQLEEHARSTN